MTSDKKNVSLLADIFVKKGLSDIIISPGSRNAPFVISFAGKEGVRALSIVDERSAGFFALGMAQQLGKAVAVACTSGSAALNYAPAIAEAYYQKIPLLVLTADRPPEMIDQGDGQTIRQKDVYRNYIKKSFELPLVLDDPAIFQIAEQVINRAIDDTRFPEPGPVHINIPFREPLYGTTEEEIDGRVIKTVGRSADLGWDELEKRLDKWNRSKKVLLIAGQMEPDSMLNKRLSALVKLDNVVVLTETTSNMHDGGFIDCIDNVVNTINDDEAGEFQPDLIVSFGGHVVSKMIKKFLRLNPPIEHWHISPSGEEMDTYFALSWFTPLRPAEFFKVMSRGIKNADSNYSKIWSERKTIAIKKRNDYLQEIPFSDLLVFDELLKSIPAKSVLHLGNSTPVRYAQLFGSNTGFLYRSNRGVSGIDGQLSTAAGSAFADDRLNTIITGDLGFFYDSNALMNHNLSPNLKIILINNGGGGIFRFISGPDSSPYLEEYFEAKHDWKAEKIAAAFDTLYFNAHDMDSLREVLPAFYAENKRPAILEIFTPSEKNAIILKRYFKSLKSDD